jgi:peroxiredoxin
LQNLYLWIAVGVVALAVLIYFAMRKASGPRPKTPAALAPGQELPQFDAVDDEGNKVSSAELAGTAAVILFVRGNWCPFCTKQVEGLTQYYKEIGDLGARLVFITPKPLETTRRVAEFFKVEFEFWLDESLHISRELGLVLPGGVPAGSKEEYGTDTVWPTALVVDAQGIIRFTSLSNFLFDRPNPQLLLKELKKI